MSTHPAKPNALKLLLGFPAFSSLLKTACTQLAIFLPGRQGFLLGPQRPCPWSQAWTEALNCSCAWSVSWRGRHRGAPDLARDGQEAQGSVDVGSQGGYAARCFLFHRRSPTGSFLSLCSPSCHPQHCSVPSVPLPDRYLHTKPEGPGPRC